MKHVLLFLFGFILFQGVLQDDSKVILKMDQKNGHAWILKVEEGKGSWVPVLEPKSEVRVSPPENQDFRKPKI